jgi:hypothetical protein
MRTPKKSSRPKTSKVRARRQDKANNGKITEKSSCVEQNIASEIGKPAAEANAKMVNRQVGVVQSQGELASRLTEQSLGLDDHERQEAQQQLSHNVAAIPQSGSVLTMGAISTEWVKLMRGCFDHALASMDAFMRCRAPEELATAQCDSLRDHLEDMIRGVHRIAEIWQEIADQASRKITRNVEGVRPVG